MSSRVLRRLREERQNELLIDAIDEQTKEDELDDNEEEEEEEEEEEVVQVARSQFQLMDSSSDEEESDDDVSEDGSNNDNEEEDSVISYDSDTEVKSKSNLSSKPSKQIKQPTQSTPQEEEEDLDDILSEFLPSNQQNSNTLMENETTLAHEIHTLFISSTKDVRDYDLEYTLKSMLGNMGQVVHVPHQNNAANSNTAGRNKGKFLFGPPKFEWGSKRPPSHVGGGLGMEHVQMTYEESTHDDDDYEDSDSDGSDSDSDSDNNDDGSDSNDGNDGNSKQDDQIKTTPNTTTTAQSSSLPSQANKQAPWPYSQSTTQSTNSNQSVKNTKSTSTKSTQSQPPQLLPQSQQQWYTFQPSKTYTSKLSENQLYISNTGDVNALAMFVSDNPYMVEPLLQLSMFFFGFNELEHGTDLLRRCLWIYECASWSGFFPSLISTNASTNTSTSNSTANSSSTSSNNKQKKKKNTVTLLDYNQEPNTTFYKCLFRYIQRSNALGCTQTALAVSKFILSLDYCTDPTGILLILDYFALTTKRSQDVQFVIDLVHAETWMGLWYRYETYEGVKESFGMLKDLPNWSFSYALALFHRNYHGWDIPQEEYDNNNNNNNEEDDIEESNESPTVQQNANQASQELEYAIHKFPMIPRLLLNANNININDRTCSIDWTSVLPPLDELYYKYQREYTHVTPETKKAIDHIMDIFVKRSHSLWKEDYVLEWLYQCCVNVVNELARKKVEREDLKDGLLNEDYANTIPTQEEEWNVSPAITRYLHFDASEFDDAVRTLPADANPLNPQLIDPIFNIRDLQHRRRFLRRPREMEELRRRRHHHHDGAVGHGGVHVDENGNVIMGDGNGRGIMLGRERDRMEVIDPDLPLMELFWRSILPWARVAGVPSANRR